MHIMESRYLHIPTKTRSQFGKEGNFQVLLCVKQLHTMQYLLHRAKKHHDGLLQAVHCYSCTLHLIHHRMCRECVELLDALGAPVDHIVLTTHAYEHKIFVPPFQRRYSTAQVWVVPRCAHPYLVFPYYYMLYIIYLLL